MNATETLNGLVTEADYTINETIRILGDVSIDGDLYIKEACQILITGNLTCNCLFIHSKTKICVRGTINCGLCIHCDTKLFIEKGAYVTNKLSIMDNSIVNIQGDLLVTDVNNIEIGDKTKLLVTGTARLLPSDRHTINTIRIGSNNETHIRGNLVAILEGYDQALWDDVTIGSNTIVLVNGRMNLDGRLTVFENSSIQIGKSLGIIGSVTLLRGCIIQTDNNLRIDLRKGPLRTESNCTISVAKDFHIAHDNAKIGRNNTLVIGETMDSNYGILLSESSTLIANVFNSRCDIKIESNCSLVVKREVLFSRRFRVESDCLIRSKTIRIVSSEGTFGQNTRLIANCLEVDKVTEGYGLCIESNSIIEIQGDIDSKVNIRLGSHVKIKARRLETRFISMGESCEIQSIHMTTDRGFYGGDYSRITTDNADFKALQLGIGSIVDVNNDLRIQGRLLILPYSRVIVKGELRSDNISMNKQSHLVALGKVETKYLYVKSSQAWLGNSLETTSVYIDSMGILFVNETLRARDLCITSTQTSESIEIHNNDAETLMPTMHVSPETRLTIGKDMHCKELHTLNRGDVTIHGDLYTQKNINPALITVNGEIVTI